MLKHQPERKHRKRLRKVKKHFVTVATVGVLAGVVGPSTVEAWTARTVDEISTDVGEPSKVGELGNYNVRWGDTLWGLSQATGFGISDFVSQFGISNPDLIYANRTLDAQGEPSDVEHPEDTYIVQPGDTLSVIAHRFDTTVEALVDLNDLSNPDLIYPGQVLVLSDEAAVEDPIDETEKPEDPVEDDDPDDDEDPIEDPEDEDPEDEDPEDEDPEDEDPEEGEQRATIIHTNDMHGRLVEADEDDDEMGMALVSGVYDHYENESDEAILVDAGDTLHGTTNVHHSDGQAMIDVMNQMGYSAMTAGNHEFNYGWERLVELSDTADFPILGANVIAEDTEEAILDDFTEWQVFGNSIGIVGLVTDETPIRTHPSNVEGITFRDDVEVAQEQVGALQDDFDHMMMLTHVGYSVDQTIAETVDGLDLIIGGHSHTQIDEPTYHNDTFIAQAYEHTKAVGVVHLDFLDGELENIEGELVTSPEGYEQNSETLALVDDIVAGVEEDLSEVIGEIDVDLDGEREEVRTSETNLGNLVTDAIRERTNADVAIMNGGGIRTSISAGEVTQNDVISVLPFINLVEAQEMTGDVLLEALEYSVGAYPEDDGRFLQMSGMSIEVDANAEPGERIISAEIGGEELDPDAVYTVGTNDFLATGGDGYEMFDGQEVVLSTGELLSEILEAYIAEGNPIPEVEERIIIND